MKKILILFALILTANSVFAYTSQEAQDKLEEICRDPHSKKEFFLTIHSNEINIANLYMEAGLVDLEDTYMGNTPLIFALSDKKPEIAINLMEHGADFKSKKFGAPIIFFAINNKLDEPAAYMIRNGAYETLDKNYKNYVLFYAVKNNLTETVSEILKANPDADIKRARLLFRLPLITTAKRHDNDEMVDMLTEHLIRFEERKAEQKAGSKN